MTATTNDTMVVGYIHEAFDGKRTVCGLTMLPMMQTTVRWAGELPTCPRCREVRGYEPVRERTP